MMTTIKTTLAALALMALPMTMCAQDKLFTLEDLPRHAAQEHVADVVGRPTHTD